MGREREAILDGAAALRELARALRADPSRERLEAIADTLGSVADVLEEQALGIALLKGWSPGPGSAPS